jgi:GNAT superfamily N-acetyltransferase
VALQPLLGGTAIAWLLTGRPVDRHRKAFLQLTRARTAAMLGEHGTLTAHVHAEYREAVRWLGWLGFEISPAQPLGPRGALFHIAGSTIAEIMEDQAFAGLVAEYASESAIDGLPPPAAQLATYRQLESSGALHALAARYDGSLVGFVTLLAPVLPHYGVTVAVSESFFVARARRRTGAGLALLRAAEALARRLGSPGLLVGAPSGGALARILPRRGYRETNRVFFKRVHDV